MSNNKIAESMNLVPLVPQVKEIKPIKTDDDYEAAKGNLDITLETAMQSLAEVTALAQQSNDARAYRIVNEILQTIIIATKTRMEIKQIDVDNKLKEATEQNPHTVNQNLFIGSTQELADMLARVKREKEE